MGFIVSISWQVKLTGSLVETHLLMYFITWVLMLGRLGDMEHTTCSKFGQVHNVHLNRWLMHRELDITLLRGRGCFLIISLNPRKGPNDSGRAVNTTVRRSFSHSITVSSQVPEPKHWGSNPALPLTSSVILENLLNLSVPQFFSSINWGYYY